MEPYTHPYPPTTRKSYAAMALVAVLALLFTLWFAVLSVSGAPASTTEDSDILFQDNFDDPNTSLTDRGWIDADNGTGEQVQPIIDGKVRLGQNPNWGTLFLPAEKLQNVSDYIVEVDIGFPTDSMSPVKSNRMGAIVVRNTNTSPDKSNGYEFSLLNNTNGNQVRVYGRSVGGASLNKPVKYDFKYDELVHFKVVVQGSHFECFIDGSEEPIFSVDHAGIATGGVGFKVTNGDAYFDNLVVRRIPTETESTGNPSDTETSATETTTAQPTTMTTRSEMSRPDPIVITTTTSAQTSNTGFHEEEDDVEVSAKPGVVPEGAKLTAVKGTSLPVGSMDRVLAKYGEQTAIGTAYVLGLEDAQGLPLENVTLEGALSARIKLEAADMQAGALKLVRFGADGSLTEVEAAFADGYASFDATALGYYAVILTEGRPTTAPTTASAPGGSDGPQTGWSLALTLSFLTLAGAAGIVMLLMTRRYQTKSE